MTKTKTLILLICIFIFSFQYLKAQPVAFPGAEGYGKYVTGGRGTVIDGRKIFLDAQVVEVTNLDDYDEGEEPIAGSFRWALSMQDTLIGNTTLKIPTTIVFRVGGVINLKRDIHTSVKHLTIAGQTAPGDGICFRGATLNFSGSENLIVRYIRSRPGDELGLETSAFRIENGQYFIIDHCSFSWAIEETTHFSSSPDFTIQWCIVSEGLYDSFHKKGPRGYGAQWGGEYSSYHHNLMANHNSRTPRINGSNENDIEALVDYRNNVNYNWGRAGAFYGGEWMKTGGKGFAHTNVVNNYFIPGPALSGSEYFASPGMGDVGYSKWHFDGNIMVGREEITNDNWIGVDVSNVGSKANIYADVEFVKTDGVFEAFENYTQTAEDAYSAVVADVGASLPKRDAHDKRLIREMTGEISIVRYEIARDDGIMTPVKGKNSGIIDTQNNLVSEEDRLAGITPWDVYQTTLPDEAPVDTDHDGMPDAWETAHQLNPSDGTDFRIITPSGYTYLEVYLAELAGDIIDYEKPIENTVNEYRNYSTVKVFPNPCINELNIQSPYPIVCVEIFNLSGLKLAETMNVQGLSMVSMAKLAQGCYIVRLHNNVGKAQIAKVIKCKSNTR